MKLTRAMASPETFAFAPNVGYVDLRFVLEPSRGGPRGMCNPPAEVADGSWHALRREPSAAITFQWLSRNRVWFRIQIGARRLAFTPDYLSSHGWKYVGPATDRHG